MGEGLWAGAELEEGRPRRLLRQPEWSGPGMAGRGSSCPSAPLPANTHPPIPGSLRLWGAHPGLWRGPDACPPSAGLCPGPRPRPDPPPPQQASGTRLLGGAGGGWPGQGCPAPGEGALSLARPPLPRQPCHLVADTRTADWHHHGDQRVPGGGTLQPVPNPETKRFLPCPSIWPSL